MGLRINNDIEDEYFENTWSKKVDMKDTAARYSTNTNKNTLQLELKRQNKIAKYKKEQELKKKILVSV